MHVYIFLSFQFYYRNIYIYKMAWEYINCEGNNEIFIVA